MLSQKALKYAMTGALMLTASSGLVFAADPVTPPTTDSTLSATANAPVKTDKPTLATKVENTKPQTAPNEKAVTTNAKAAPADKTDSTPPVAGKS